MSNKKSMYYILFFINLFLVGLFNIIALYLYTIGWGVMYIKTLRTIGNTFVILFAILEFNKNKFINKYRDITVVILILVISVINFIIIWI